MRNLPTALPQLALNSTFGKIHRLRGFTIIELLVAIAIIAVLISFMLPMLSRTRQHARSSVCSSNEKQLFQAMTAYALSNDSLYPRPGFLWDTPSTTGPMCAWAMDSTGIADYTVGTIWPYLAPDLTGRMNVMNCPSENDERAHLGGAYLTIQRNFTYSLNGYIINPPLSSTSFLTLRFGQVIDCCNKIMIYEEVGPNDGVCYNPFNNTDDWPSGRHGQDLNPTSTEYTLGGRGNFCFFDGHVASLAPADTFANSTMYQPLH